MKEQPLYKEDWIGLKQLDEEKKLHLMKLDGDHAEITSDIMKFVIVEYVLKYPKGKKNE